MVLTTETKEKIMNVRDYYDKKDQLVDIRFIREIIKIMQKDELFNGTLRYQFIKERKDGPAYVQRGIAYFNLPLFLKYIKDRVKYNFNDYPKENNLKYYNFMAIWVIFHECSHVCQQRGLEKYSEINRLYSDLYYTHYFFKKEMLKFLRTKINLLIKKGYDCFERQANIDASRELVEMYQESEFLDLIELFHIYFLSFEPKGISIAHDTLNKLLLEYNYDTTGIPKYLLFEVGLPTPKKYTHDVYKAINKYFDDELSYQDVMRRIRK